MKREHRDVDRDRDRERDGRRDDPRRDDRAKEVHNGQLPSDPRGRTDDHKKSPVPAAQSEEEKIRQRRERLEAWKRKKAEEEAKKLADSPAAALSALEKPLGDGALPAGKSVPGPSKKAPAQQSTASASSKVSAPRPKADQGSSVAPSAALGMLPSPAVNIDRASTVLTHIGPANGSALPTNRPVSTFGFGKKNAADGIKGKRTLDFGDEESSRKKLERLPSPIPGEADATDAVQEDVDDDTEMQDATEEESAAAARAAAAQREERRETEGAMDVDTQAPSEPAPAPAPEAAPVEEEEEIDPLDAFMTNISHTVAEVSSKDRERAEATELLGDDEIDLVANEQEPEDILAMAAKMKKKKELPAINHSKVHYEPFRKSFYAEPLELKDLTEEDVDNLRLELDAIKIRGQDVPKPVQKWSQCGLPSQSLNVIQSLGYDRPTSIQAQAIPAIMSGRDVIGVAKTGSGKTIAFLLPMFRHIKDQRPLESLDGPISIIMTPTRELAVQIFKECKVFLKALNLRVRLLSHF